MKILTFGTGNSLQDFTKQNSVLKDDIVTFALHRAVPYVLQNSTHKVDYWTWFDPNAAIDGLKYYNQTKATDFPTIIIPDWLLTAESAKPNIGGSFFFSNKEDIKLYEATLSELQHKGKVIALNNIISTKLFKKGHEAFTNPSIRFKDKIYYGTDWGLDENKFTLTVLPLCHYLKATEVYSLGFDNQGININKMPIHSSKTKPHLDKLKTWSEWEHLHGMKIYSCAEDRYTPNNKIITYKPIKELCKI